MSKPTKEVVELSKKLHELGYELILQKGDLVYHEKYKSIYVVLGEQYTHSGSGSSNSYQAVALNHFCGYSRVEDIIPIPSLSDGLLWLDEQRERHHRIEIGWGRDRENRYWCECETLIEKDKRYGETRHEAVLKAMAEVLESK